MAEPNHSVDQKDQPVTKPGGGPVYWLATGFGSGLAPKAPGTAGTLVAIPLYLLAMQLPFWQYVVIVALVTLVGIWICGSAARQMGVHDHPSIVWDEIAGFLITMMAAPVGWIWIVTGFVLFRFFDIVKPWPIRSIDRQVKGGMGIMLDDVIAGFFAWIVLQVIGSLV